MGQSKSSPTNKTGARPHERIPVEIWMDILARGLSNKDLKSMARVNRRLMEITRAYLWRCPRLKKRITLADLQYFAEIGIPLTVAKLSHFDYCGKSL